MIQIRDKRSRAEDMIKTAKAIMRRARRYKVPVIVNDRPDVAVAASADGLHIGQGDISVPFARKIIGGEKILGVSVRNLAQAKRAKDEGADYLGAGPIFRTPVKSKYRPKGIGFLEHIGSLGIPFFAIGGIDRKNISKLTCRGFRRIAVIRAVCASCDPFSAARALKEALI